MFPHITSTPRQPIPFLCAWAGWFETCLATGTLFDMQNVLGSTEYAHVVIVFLFFLEGDLFQAGLRGRQKERLHFGGPSILTKAI